MRWLTFSLALLLPVPATADCEALLGGVDFFASPFYVRTAKEPEGGIRRAREALERAADECQDARPFLLLATLRRACDERRHLLGETCTPTVGGRRLDGVAAILDAGRERFPGDVRLVGLRLLLEAAALDDPGLAPTDATRLRRQLATTLAAALPDGGPPPEDGFLLVAAGRARLALGEHRAAADLALAAVQRDPDLADARELLFAAQLAGGEEEEAIAEVEKRAGRPPAARLDLTNRRWERRRIEAQADSTRLLRQAADLAARRRMVTQAIHLYALSLLPPGGRVTPAALRRDAAFVATRRRLGRLLPASRKARLGLLVISLRDDRRDELRRVAEALVGL